MMSTSKSKTAKASTATLAVDYTPEVAAARDIVRKAATAFKAWSGRGDGTILPQCVEATRVALESGFLADGRATDKVAGSVSAKAYAAMFGLSSGSEVTFWRTLATAVAAGVTIGSDLWDMLALASGSNTRLAKATSVAKVIREGGDVEAIRKAVEAERADRDRRKASGRKARPASEPKDTTPDGIPVTADPKADALLAALALDAACKRIPVEDADAWAAVRKAVAATMRRETTLRKPKAAEAAAA